MFQKILTLLKFANGNNDEWKMCVFCGKVLKKIHNMATAGHLGIAKIIAHLAQYYY